jgi:aquaporin Z
MAAKALVAEAVGAFVLVAVTCGAHMIAAPAGGGIIAPAIGAGLAMMALHASLAHVSGAHFNPAVTIGLIAAGRFDTGNAVGYLLAQVLGALAAAFMLQAVLASALSSGPATGVMWNGLTVASNSYGAARGFDMTGALVVEIFAAAVLLFVFVGTTGKKGVAGMAPLAIGATLAMLMLVAIPVTNASLNPARSTATAVLAGGAPLSQLWVFWLAPIVGGIIGGSLAKWLQDD